VQLAPAPRDTVTIVQDGKPPPELHALREKWLGAVWPAE
jgi:hypothetical protein